MNGLFRDVSRAVGYLVLGLNETVHEGHLEISWYPKVGLPRRVIVPHYEVIHPLERYCRKFIAATVVYDTMEGLGFVGAIQCRCDHTIRGACPCHCTSHQDRPTVRIIACDAGNPPTDEQRLIAEAYCQSLIQKYLREQHDIGFHPKHHH